MANRPLTTTTAKVRAATVAPPAGTGRNVPSADGDAAAVLPTPAVQRSYTTLVVVIFLAYLAVGAGLYIWRGAYFTPDRWLILLLIGAVVMGRAMAFLRDWVPVVFLIAGYEFMRKLAGQLVNEQGRHVHVRDLIDADRAIFGGHLPTLWLQGKLYVPGQVHGYDYVALLFYSLHFVFPLAFAFMLWLTRKERFWQFSLTFLLMTYAAFAFFLYYPAAPPWLAERWGFVKGVQWPAQQAYQAMPARTSTTQWCPRETMLNHRIGL
jgi:hypothetical protein